MRPLRFAGLVALALSLGVCGSGCSTKKVLEPDLPPKTQLFVHYDPTDGVPHSVHHVARLFWFGTDPDGYVVGYDIRFLWPGGPANPPWTRTTRTDSLFVIPDTTGLVNPVFEVRAVDDHGVVDPSPPRQEFSFTNQAPIVTLLDPPGPSETTFASQTIDWSGVDPDGDAGLLTYHIWLDGNQANPHVTTATEFTFPTSDFLQGGRLRTGSRTAFVQAIDVGGRAGPIASVTWQVQSPVPDTLQRARLLVIDDVRSTESGNSVFEGFFNNAITRSGIPAGSWRVLSLENARPFRSSKDLEQSLKLFDAVVWYHGQVPIGGQAGFSPTRDTLLTRHADGLAGYLDAGGNFYIEAPDLVASGADLGQLSEGFMRAYLGSDFLYRQKPPGTADSTVSWSYAQSFSDVVNGTSVTHLAILHSTVFNDSLKIASNGAGIRAFGVRDTNDVVLWARDSVLVNRQKFSAPVAVRASTGGGKIVVSSIPMIAAGGPTAGGRFMDKIFQYLGIKP